jgi:hypothetical protein
MPLRRIRERAPRSSLRRSGRVLALWRKVSVSSLADETAGVVSRAKQSIQAEMRCFIPSP